MQVPLAASTERRAPPLPRGCRPLLLPSTHFELEVNEAEGGAKYEEIALWGLSGSMAIKPKVELSDCGWFVLVEYDTKKFLNPEFLAGNPDDHGPLYPVMLYRYQTMVRELTCNYTEFPRYIVQIELRTCQGREIVFEGLHFKRLNFDYGQQRQRENIDVMRIFVKSDWDDVTRKREPKTKIYKFDSDSDDDDDDGYGPKDYRNSAYTPQPAAQNSTSNRNSRSAGSNNGTRQRDTENMSVVSEDGTSSKRPRNRGFSRAPSKIPPPANDAEVRQFNEDVIRMAYHLGAESAIPDLAREEPDYDWAVEEGMESAHEDLTPTVSPANQGYAKDRSWNPLHA